MHTSSKLCTKYTSSIERVKITSSHVTEKKKKNVAFLSEQYSITIDNSSSSRKSPFPKGKSYELNAYLTFFGGTNRDLQNPPSTEQIFLLLRARAYFLRNAQRRTRCCRDGKRRRKKKHLWTMLPRAGRRIYQVAIVQKDTRTTMRRKQLFLVPTPEKKSSFSLSRKKGRDRGREIRPAELMHTLIRRL